MKIATILNTHENSEVFRDTLESVKKYLSDDVLVLVDGYFWNQFENDDTQALKLCGFKHNSNKAPFRNIALGLSKAWDIWGESVDWYCVMEYDCLVASSEVKNHLRVAKEKGCWCVGNDLRILKNKQIPIINVIAKKELNNLYYFLGCCLFYNSDFIKKLVEKNFFNRFLNFTNFYLEEINLINPSGKKEMVYDLSEYLYPTLAVFYGGKIMELARWDKTNEIWQGNAAFYPMRFRPDLNLNDPFQNACVLHPLKTFENPVRQYFRELRKPIN